MSKWLVLILLLPLQTQAHMMTYLDNKYKTYINANTYYLTNSYEFDAVYKVEVIDKENKKVDPSTWRTNFKDNTVNMLSPISPGALLPASPHLELPNPPLSLPSQQPKSDDGLEKAIAK